jgi:ribose 5-phosphate isomerase B
MIYIASDHIGVALKARIIEALKEKGESVEDLGPQDTERVNYTDFAKDLCAQILADNDAKGILICGTGIGMSMMANRHKGIRAAVCAHEYVAEMTRKHNDANILCLGSRVTGEELALAIVDKFLATEFEGGRHLGRVQQMDGLTEVA